MEETLVNETIKVGAVFEANLIRPKWFIWKGKSYRVARVTYRWKERVGRTDIHHLAVSDGVNLFELAFDNTALSWRLIRVICGGDA